MALLTIGLLFSCGNVDEETPPKVVPLEKRTEGPLTVLVAGDTMLDDMALPYIKKYGYGYPLAKVRDFLLSADIVNLNLEVPVPLKCSRSKTKKYAYHMLPEGLAAIHEAGVSVVNLANNHALDCGKEGLAETVKNLDAAGIEFYGAGIGHHQRHRGLVFDINGTKVGFVGWYKESSEMSEAGVAHISETAIRTDISALRKQADVVIATFHWGENYRRLVSQKQITLGRLAIDAGADAVIGHHPHIIQGMEIYNGKPILYSVGNFVFATGNYKAAYGLAAKFIITDNKITQLDCVPIFNQNRNKNILWQVKLAKGKESFKALKDFIADSARMGTALEIENDVATIQF